MKIAIYGPMCSGKSTIASIINEYDNRYKIYSFTSTENSLLPELTELSPSDFIIKSEK